MARFRALIFLVVVTIAVSCTTCVDSQEEPNVAEPIYAPFEFSTEEFGQLRIEEVDKISVKPDDGPTIPTDAPAHRCYHLDKDRPMPAFEKGGRYFFPAYSFVCIAPTSDTTESDFNSAYPSFSKAVIRLRKLLVDKPKEFSQFDDLFDFPYNNAGWSIMAKLDYLEFEDVRGVFFLIQYAQDIAPGLANNEELTANFQGLTRDGKYYVGAKFAIAHPDLPRGIDFTDPRIQSEALAAKTTDEIGTRVQKYLEAESAKVEAFADSSFTPSIPDIKKLIGSISP